LIRSFLSIRILEKKAQVVTRENQANARLHAPVSTGKITRLAAMLAICLIALSTGALIAVGIVASHEADKQMTASQMILLRNSLNDEFTRMARDQLTVAHWNDAVENIAINPNNDFMRMQVADSLINDFAHDQVYLIGPDTKPLMVASPSLVTFSPKKSDLSDDVVAIAAEATDGYRAAGVSGRRGIDRKSKVKAVPLDSAHYAFGQVDGKVVMLSAMPVLPDDTSIMALARAPAILVSMRVLSDDILSSIGNALHFDALKFGPAEKGQLKPDAMTISSAYGEKLGTLEWTSRHPGPAVWHVIVPLILVLALVFSAVAVSIAIKIGRVSEKLELSEQQNKLLALRDSLTGLSNRLHFNMLVDDMVTEAERHPFAVMACDLDRFKAVNDTFGHAAGDLVIQNVAERLKQIVGTLGVVTRIGGDEFIVLIDAFWDAPRLKILSQDIVRAVVQPIDLKNGNTAEVGISIGIVISDRQECTKEALMHSADQALYVAKAKGRGQSIFAHTLGETDLIPKATACEAIRTAAA